jgi:hypothetical protein
MKTILPDIKLITMAIPFLMIACNKFEDHIYFFYKVDYPEVITYAPENVTSNTATLSGCITSTGQGVIVNSGIYIYKSGSDPDLDQTPHKAFNEKRYSKNSSVGDFSILLSDLKPNTTYHYRAFAANQEFTSYGEMMILVTINNKVSDNEGNTIQ